MIDEQKLQVSFYILVKSITAQWTVVGHFVFFYEYFKMIFLPSINNRHREIFYVLTTDFQHYYFFQYWLFRVPQVNLSLQEHSANKREREIKI